MNHNLTLIFGLVGLLLVSLLAYFIYTLNVKKSVWQGTYTGKFSLGSTTFYKFTTTDDKTVQLFGSAFAQQSYQPGETVTKMAGYRWPTKMVQNLPPTDQRT